MVPTMDTPAQQPASNAVQHLRRARYFRTMALTASTADVAVTLVRLAVHYERLAKQRSPAIPPNKDTREEELEVPRPRHHKSATDIRR
jgi:hypothetical protein